MIEIGIWHWVGFIVCLLFFLALDVGVFHRHAHVVKFREALTWTTFWICLALLFSLGLRHLRGPEGPKESLEFLTGYLLELSLSMDNVFVIALIFAYFRIPSEHQHRVLFWGILGALIMRGLMIGLGVAIISMLHWVLYLLGAFVLFTGVRMLFVETEVHPENNRVVRLARKLYPVTPFIDGQKFITHWEGRRALTPLALVLLMVETTDLIFAVDSIPAIFAVTTDPFIVFTSNMFAILGLRSLYFVLAGALQFFRYLKAGLAVVLSFIGLKMLLSPHGREPLPFQVEIPISISLLVVAGILLLSILASVIATHREKRRKGKQDGTGKDKRDGTGSPKVNSDNDMASQQGSLERPKENPPATAHEPLSRTLAKVLQGVSDGTEITLNRLLERTAGRSLYLLIILLCLPFMIPVSMPGLSTLLGSIIIFLMLRQAMGKPPRLPKVLGEKKLPPKVEKRVLGGSIRFLAVLERVVRPRRTQWLATRPAVLLNTLLIVFLALLLALPLPAPPFFFSNSLPSYAIVVLAVSMMEEDGLTIWIGYALLLVNIAFFSLIGGALLELLLKLWQVLRHAAGV